MSRLEQIEELEDRINDRLQLILSISQNGQMVYDHPITYEKSIEIRKDLQNIDSHCKELAKLTARAIGRLQAYDKRLEDD